LNTRAMPQKIPGVWGLAPKGTKAQVPSRKKFEKLFQISY